MAPRVRLTLVVAGILALVGAAGALAFLANEGSDEAAAGFEGAIRPPGIPPQELTGLRDENGDTVRLADLRGKPVVVTFLYTTCTDTCPLTAQQIRGALDDLGHDVPALAISVDPPNDTRDRAKRFLVKQQVIGRMRFLLGDRAALKRQWDAYGIAPQRDGKEHSAYVVLLDQEGRQRIGFPVDQLTPERLAHDLRELEQRAS